MRELQHMFSGKKLKLSDRVLALPTTQHTAMELVNWGDDAAVEKDRCLECFVAFAESLRGALAARGHTCLLHELSADDVRADRRRRARKGGAREGGGGEREAAAGGCG